MMDDGDSGATQERKSTIIWRNLQQRYQKLLDDSVPHTIGRWVFAFLLLCFFLGRVLIMQGWYIVTYALGIYYLNLFVGFITPRIDPALEFDDDAGPELPTRANEEFRPFIRRLPEFKFWYSVAKSTLIALICSFFEVFNVPVFWPILVMYFFTLFGITMKRQIKHMIKYRYIPFTHGKPKYQGHEEPGKVPVASTQRPPEEVEKVPIPGSVPLIPSTQVV
ncbi:protein RER1 [Frankliniella occidentalis]|uniref:Protein RER1 n=1 Tax=Frankliniella occidentalis TaxID=133901 RepID=A0A6J1SLS5_FRAOC|nr:protein RER1 [Frankliniella occidentalis]XP_052127605.1 protein RER1 [Frankliniella occidentalis]